MTAGYSGTPLAKKLGIKEGFTVLAISPPDNYRELLDPLPVEVKLLSEPRTDVDVIHLSTSEILRLKKSQAAIHAIGLCIILDEVAARSGRAASRG